MAAAALVSEEIAGGHNVVAALDAAGFSARAAFWFYDSDADIWKLWIATPEAGEDLQKAYLKIGRILSAIGDRPVLDLPRMSDVRFKSNVVNGIYIADALIYRTAA